MTDLSLIRTTAGTTSDVDQNLNLNWTELEVVVNGGLDAGNLATNAVGNTQLQNDSVDATKIAANAVGTSEIAANGVGTSELADDSVTVAKILQGSNGALLSSAGGATAWSAVGAAGEALIATGSGVEWNPLTSRAISQQGTMFELVSSSTQTTVWTTVVPANTIGTHDCLHLVMRGDYLNDTGVDRTLGLACQFGGVTWYGDTKTAIATGGNRRMFFLELLIANGTTTNSQVCHGMFHLSTSTAAAVAGIGTLDATATAPSYFGAPTSTIDTTSNQDFTVQFKHSAALATLSLRMFYGMLLVHTS